VTSDDLLRRLRRLEDRAELRELADRYCLAIDDSDWPALLGMFTADAEMAGVTGGQQVVDVLRQIRSGYGRTIHTAIAQTLTFDDSDDDWASGVIVSRAELAIAGQTVLSAMRYFDQYTRVNGEWRFASRTLRFSYALPWPDMAGALTADRPVHWPGADALPADDMQAASRA
jgi:SnoaL-like domain